MMTGEAGIGPPAPLLGPGCRSWSAVWDLDQGSHPKALGTTARQGADGIFLIAPRALSLAEPASCLSSLVTTSRLSQSQHSDVKLTHVAEEGAGGSRGYR